MADQCQPRRGRVLREAHITRSTVRARPDTIFCFGDNLARRGMKGQAEAMRGEPNTIGVPTKWKPERTDDAYFTDADGKLAQVRDPIIEAFQAMEAALTAGRDVVIPTAGLGTGRAQLPTRAPSIHRAIERRIRELAQIWRDLPDRPADGAFPCFQSWVSHAASWIGGTNPLCADAKDRVCRIGADFMRADTEGAFPVRFWYGAGDQTAKELRMSRSAARRSMGEYKFRIRNAVHGR